MKSRFSRGIQKHIRIEKARIRREFIEPGEIDEQIQKLYAKFSYMNTKGAKEIANT